ncbi:hypothetical protein HanRHA438_Chr17g0836841 [Helianthus annuus]|nr:hypothetical protein HanRHA438_Chr17g0836841 [Helianthus annuus]
MRFMHKFSANLHTRCSPRFPFNVDRIFVTSYINDLFFPWYLQWYYNHISENIMYNLL